MRRPRIDYESHATGLDRNEVGAQFVAAGLGTAAEHALVSLLALNGLRVSEATGADIEALGTERGHGTGPWRSPARAARKPSSRSPRAPPARSTSPSASAATGRSSPPLPGSGWTGTAPEGSSAASPAAPDWPRR